MADLLTGIDFRNKKTGYTKQELPKVEAPVDMARIEAEIAQALMGGMSLCDYAEAFGGPFVAPESDPA